MKDGEQGDLEGGGGRGEGRRSAAYLSDGDGECFVTGPALVHIVVGCPLSGLHLGGGDLGQVRLSVLHHVYSFPQAS